MYMLFTLEVRVKTIVCEMQRHLQTLSRFFQTKNVVQYL